MYLWQSSLPACIWRCFVTSTSSFINIFHDYLSWSYSCKTGECDFYTVTRNSQSEHYPMYKMIWLDGFVVQIRNLYMKQPIRTLYPMHKMIWLDDFVVQIRNSYSKQPIRTLYPMHKMIRLDDFVVQIRNSYSKILWQSGLDFCILLKDNIFPTIGILSDKTIEIIAGIDKGILLIIC
jgi:hypothetical protein